MQIEKDEQTNLVLNEIISTEEEYTQKLYYIIEHYMDPLKKAKILTDEQFIQIFCNIGVLSQFHQLFLITMKAHPQHIPQLFIQYGDFLKLYTEYVNNYPTMITTVDELIHHSKSFQTFLFERNEKSITEITSYLILPVQRIPRYELLLVRLLKTTRKYMALKDQEEPTSTENKIILSKIDQAIDKVQFVAIHLNESRRVVENLILLLDIEKRIENLPFSLLKPARYYKCEGLLNLKTPRLIGNPLKKTVMLLLFSDCFLICDTQYVFKNIYSFIQSTLTLNSTNCFSIYIKSLNKNLEFETETKEECDHWYNLFNELIGYFENDECKKIRDNIEKVRKEKHENREKVHQLLMTSINKLYDNPDNIEISSEKEQKELKDQKPKNNRRSWSIMKSPTKSESVHNIILESLTVLQAKPRPSEDEEQTRINQFYESKKKTRDKHTTLHLKVFDELTKLTHDLNNKKRINIT